MKYSLRKSFWTLLGCSLFSTTACVNQVATEGVADEKIPITFSLRINNVPTKVSDNAFEDGDRIGLFAMLDGTSMDEDRYIDNMMLTCTSDEDLFAEEVVFYPEGGTPLDFVAYYPYSEDGVEDGSSVITVSIQSDQHDAEGRSLSDFMVASRNGVEGSEKSVELEFDHQLVKLKVCLTPDGDTDIDEMLADNPRIWATGFYTQAEYDLNDGTFSNFSEVSDIELGGEWKKRKNRLEGCEVILLPQEIDDNQGFQMEWNGRIYTCPFPKMKELESNMQYELEINSREEDSYVMTGMVASINEWGDEEMLDEVENSSENEMLHLAALDFEKTNVYRVSQNGKDVAEICKEYLVSKKWASQAITVYEVDESGDADLSRGMVLQFLDNDEETNGGTISWDEEENMFDYTPGDLPDIENLYFDEDGEISVEKPDNPATFYVVAEMLRDLRDGLREYPIVKIGTQYWMRENLKAEKYRDGSEIAQPKDLDGTPGCFYVEKHGLYFYNGEALNEKEVSPGGWRLPSVEDWNLLEDYLEGNAWLVKAGTWKSLDTPVNEGEFFENPDDANKAMLYVYPSGCWDYGDNEESGHIYSYRQIGFWAWDDENEEVSDEGVFFEGNKDDFLWKSSFVEREDYYKGLSIRCIKE